MNDMTVVLHCLVEIDLYVMRIARKVVTGKVNQHDMLGILFRIGKQSFGTLSVQCNVSRAESRACNRVDACMSVGYLAVRFRWRAEDTESSEVEVKQIGRGIDAPESPVNLEVVSFERLFEPAAQHDLENVSTETMTDAFAHHCFIFFPADRRCLRAGSLEVIRSIVPVFYQGLYLLQTGVFAGLHQLDERQFIFEVVEDKYILI